VDGKTCTSLSNSLKSFYLKIIAPHEAYLEELGKQSNNDKAPSLSPPASHTAKSETSYDIAKVEETITPSDLSHSSILSSDLAAEIEKIPTPQDTVWLDKAMRIDILAEVAAKVQARDQLLPKNGRDYDAVNSTTVKQESKISTELTASSRSNTITRNHMSQVKREADGEYSKVDNSQRRSKRVKKGRNGKSIIEIRLYK
jgi:hypothetical protein